LEGEEEKILKNKMESIQNKGEIIFQIRIIEGNFESVLKGISNIEKLALIKYLEKFVEEFNNDFEISECDMEDK
jgi:hypothetical protein